MGGSPGTPSPGSGRAEASRPGRTGPVFRSRLARRVFFLFLGCSLLPLGGLAYFSQEYVSRSLIDHAWNHLRQSARAGSSTLAERLTLVENELREAVGYQGGFRNDRDPKLTERSFRWIAVITPPEPPVAILGDPPPLGPLTPDETAHLGEGHSLLRTAPGTGSIPRVILFVPGQSVAADGTLLVGEIRPERLWDAEDDLLVALDEAGRVLRVPSGVATPPAGVRAEIAAGERIGRTSWSYSGGRVIGWTRTVFLKPRFHTVWTLVAAESEAALLVGVRDFRAILASVGLLTGLVVIFLSLTQIRRTLFPVEVLRKAAEAMSAQQFETRVSIATGDEFEALGETFNHMAENISTHVQKIEAVNRVGLSLSSEEHAGGLMEAVLRGAMEATSADGGVLSLAADRGLRTATAHLESQGGTLQSPGRGGEPGDEPCPRVADQALHTASLVAVDDLYAPGLDDVAGDLAFDRAHGYRTRSLLAVPMRDQDGQVLGVLQLMNPHRTNGKPGAFSDEDRSVAASLASQAGVALGSHQRTTALEANERRFRDLVENSPAAICIHGLDGTLRYVNPAWAEWLGRRVDDCQGHAMAEFLLPAAQGLISEYLQHLRDGGTASGLATFATAAGEPRTWAYRSVRCEGSEMGPYVIGYAQDVTDQRTLERHVQQAQKMEAIGTLAGGIAHDFNNILNAVVGYTELAQLQVRGETKAHGYLSQVLKASERAQDLVGQILAFSRRQDNKRERIDLGPLTKEILKLIRAALPTTIQIHSEIDPDATTVLADATQVHQVLMNLCTNAGHAMRATGGVLDVSLHAWDNDGTEDAPAHLSPGSYVRLTVQDTGCGMTADVLQRVFEPFFTTKPVGEGTGMGLAVVHGIVSDHGGAITVQSAPGRGTTFDVYLPRLTADADGDTAESSAGEAAPPTGSGERVLFVDDEDAIADLGEQMLTTLGYAPSSHRDPVAALAAFRAEPDAFDLVITDYTMPGLTGEALIRELRALRPDLPVILCTGYSHAVDGARATELGIDAYCLKPLRLPDLGREVQRVLATRREGPSRSPEQPAA